MADPIRTTRYVDLTLPVDRDPTSGESTVGTVAVEPGLGRVATDAAAADLTVVGLADVERAGSLVQADALEFGPTLRDRSAGYLDGDRRVVARTRTRGCRARRRRSGRKCDRDPDGDGTGQA